MDAMQFFWLFLMLVALQPVLRQRWLLAARQKLIGKFERRRGSRVILLVHRQETMSLLGFPVMRFIDIADSEAIIDAINRTDPDVPIDLVLHTPGGLVLASYQIARAIRHHRGKTTVFVPHHALSGGTLIALAADEIVMTSHAVLGPVDPQIGQFPAASLLRVIKTKSIEHIDDETLIMADVAEKAVGQLRAIVEEMLAGSYPREIVEELAELLTQGSWTHDYPINCDQAKGLGLHISLEMPDEVLELMQLFPQPTRRAAAVEYGRERRDKPEPAVPSPPVRKS
jgi:ClpP class serine protease